MKRIVLYWVAIFTVHIFSHSTIYGQNQENQNGHVIRNRLQIQRVNQLQILHNAHMRVRPVVAAANPNLNGLGLRRNPVLYQP